jgi:hypothetical protein
MDEHMEAAAKDDVEYVTSTTTTTATMTATKEKAKRNIYSNRDNCSFQIALHRPKGSVL